MDEITDSEFDLQLETIVDGLSCAQLLSIPGIYEILAEEFNNKILLNIKEERAVDPPEEDYDDD